MLLNKPEVDSSLPLNVKQEGGNGVPPTPKECGYPAYDFMKINKKFGIIFFIIAIIGVITIIYDICNNISKIEIIILEIITVIVNTIFGYTNYFGEFNDGNK